MGENVCNEDLKIKFSISAGPPDAVYTGDIGQTNLAMMLNKDVDCECPNGKKVCSKETSYNFTAALPCPHTSATHTFVSGTGKVTATASDCEANGEKVHRKGDTGNCAGSWTNNQTGAPVPCSCSTEISDAGQEDVDGT